LSFSRSSTPAWLLKTSDYQNKKSKYPIGL
jgi:hypothetical protein